MKAVDKARVTRQRRKTVRDAQTKVDGFRHEVERHLAEYIGEAEEQDGPEYFNSRSLDVLIDDFGIYLQNVRDIGD